MTPTPETRALASHPFSGTDVWQLVLLRAEVSGDLPAMVWQPFEGESRTWTYAELARDAAAIAAGMSSRGIRAGDRVLIHLENCPEFVLAWYACAAMGAVAVTTNTRSAGDELSYFADDCEASGAITQPRFAELVSASATNVKWMVVTDNDAGAEVEAARLVRSDDAFASLFHDPSGLAERSPDPMARTSVQYTSGTTSRPKGVAWTHANALWAARVNASHEDLHPTDCHLVYMPLFHANAMGYSVLPSLWVGARFVLIPKWSTSRFWDISLHHRCTWLSLMGLSLRAVVSTPPPDTHTYRLFGTGVGDGPWDRALGVKTIGWWGMTETVSHGIVGDPYVVGRALAIGRPAPEYGIAIVRSDGRTPVEPEETGDLLVKGTPGLSLFAEYLNQPEATAESFDEWGWFRTGDQVTPHEDGFITFDGRSKDMLKVGAENVAAAEVERVILETGLVTEVAVVGRSDQKLDEVPVAFVVPGASVPDLSERVLEACRSRLADFKVPRDIFAVREMPRSTLNKISKVELRKVSDADADRASAESRWLEEAKVDPSGDAT
jgi:crotonobetaine/carnitine-CoA ligase